MPSLWSLVPTLGTALLILFASSDTLAGRFLASKPLVGVGLVSYSAYLWHQPLFVFARHRFPDDPTPAVFGVLAVGCFGLAFLTWKFVEQPFRDRTAVGTRTLVAGCTLGFALFISASIATLANSGFVQRFSPPEREMLALGGIDYKEALRAYGLGKCFIDYDQTVNTLVREGCITPRDGRPKLIVFGDSKAAHLISGVRAVFGRDFDVNQWAGTSCRPVIVPGTKPRCVDAYRVFMREVVPRLQERDVVLVAGSWINTAEEDPQALRLALLSLLEALKQSGARTVVVGNTPQFWQSPQNLLVKKDISADGEIYLRSQDIGPTESILRDAAAAAGVAYGAPSSALCRPKDPLVCRVYDGKDFFFFDSGHLSPAGSYVVARELSAAIMDRR